MSVLWTVLSWSCFTSKRLQKNGKTPSPSIHHQHSACSYSNDDKNGLAVTIPSILKQNYILKKLTQPIGVVNSLIFVLSPTNQIGVCGNWVWSLIKFGNNSEKVYQLENLSLLTDGILLLGKDFLKTLFEDSLGIYIHQRRNKIPQKSLALISSKLIIWHRRLKF